MIKQWSNYAVFENQNFQHKRFNIDGKPVILNMNWKIYMKSYVYLWKITQSAIVKTVESKALQEIFSSEKNWQILS